MTIKEGEAKIEALEHFLYAVVKASKISNKKMLENLGEVGKNISPSRDATRKEFKRISDLFCTQGTIFDED